MRSVPATLADLIAPSGCEIRRDHLRLDGHYARVLAVTAYPRLVSPGWLSLLVESDLPIELSLHVRPLASADMVRALGVQIARLQSSRLAALRGERVADPEREIALEDAERLRERLQRGEERLFAVSLYLLLRAKSPRELDELTRRVEEQLDALLAHSRRALWEQERGFVSCLPEARDALLVPRNLDTSALAATLPFVGPSMAMETGMLVGLAGAGQTPVLLDPFDRSLDNANLVVIAPAGAGKSFFCKLLVLRQLINGTDCIAVDPENEYRPLAEAAGGQVVRLAASSAHHLNPFDLPLGCTERPARETGGRRGRSAGRAGDRAARPARSHAVRARASRSGQPARSTTTSEPCSTAPFTGPTRGRASPPTWPPMAGPHRCWAICGHVLATCLVRWPPAWPCVSTATSRARSSPACSLDRRTSSSTGRWWSSTSSSSTTSCARWPST